MCTGLGNDGEAEGAAPGSLCMHHLHWVSAGVNYQGVSRRRGWEVIYRLAVPTHLPTYLSMCTCHVHGCMFLIWIFTSETFMSYLMPVPPFKCYYSMHYPYLGHCPKAFERPRSGLGHLCGIVFSLSSNPKQLLVHCL